MKVLKWIWIGISSIFTIFGIIGLCEVTYHGGLNNYGKEMVKLYYKIKDM